MQLILLDSINRHQPYDNLACAQPVKQASLHCDKVKHDIVTTRQQPLYGTKSLYTQHPQLLSPKVQAAQHHTTPAHSTTQHPQLSGMALPAM